MHLNVSSVGNILWLLIGANFSSNPAGNKYKKYFFFPSDFNFTSLLLFGFVPVTFNTAFDAFSGAVISISTHGVVIPSNSYEYNTEYLETKRASVLSLKLIVKAFRWSSRGIFL